MTRNQRAEQKNGYSSSSLLGLTDNTSQRLQDLTNNIITLRTELFRNLLDRRRNIEDECGYPRDTDYITTEFFQRLYNREAVAARVVQVYSKESWQVQPLVYEDEDARTVTEFEKAWDALGSGMRGEPSWYAKELGNPIWEYLARADELSGIGRYGVILLGLNDGQDPSMEVKPRKGMVLKYLRVFPESLAQISNHEVDPRSSRHGQPTKYLITLNNPGDYHGGIGLQTATLVVHWSRVIHVADVYHQATSSEIFAVPRMLPVLNHLLGLRKLYHGSAEMYWRGAFPGYTLETHPQLGGDVRIDETKTRDTFEQWWNGLQRGMALTGMSLKSHSPQVVDPTPQINTQIEAICVCLGVPVPVFKGYEIGEQASTENRKDWNERLRQRQRNYLTPRLIIPFCDRLITLGVLPRLKDGYLVEWPDINTQSSAEKASVASATTAALAQYVQGGVEALVPPMDYLTRVHGFTEEEAESVLMEAAKLEEERQLETVDESQELTGVDPSLSMAGEEVGSLIAEEEKRAFASDEQV